MAEYKQCSWCNGTGEQTCDRCNGSGKVSGRVSFNKQYTCSKCGGSGKIMCHMCNGQGYKYE